MYADSQLTHGWSNHYHSLAQHRGERERALRGQSCCKYKVKYIKYLETAPLLAAGIRTQGPHLFLPPAISFNTKITTSHNSKKTTIYSSLAGRVRKSKLQHRSLRFCFSHFIILFIRVGNITDFIRCMSLLQSLVQSVPTAKCEDKTQFITDTIRVKVIPPPPPPTLPMAALTWGDGGVKCNVMMLLFQIDDGEVFASQKKCDLHSVAVVLDLGLRQTLVLLETFIWH